MSEKAPIIFCGALILSMLTSDCCFVLSPCISDLKCVLNVKGMSRIFLSLPSSTGDHSSFSSNDGIALDNWIKVSHFSSPK